MQSFPFEWVPNQHNTSLYCLTNPDVVKTIAIQSPVKPNDSYRSLIYALTIPIAVLDILGFILFTSLHNRFLLIKARPIYMNLIMAIASFVWNLLIMKIEISGRHSVPCPAFISTAYLTFGVTLSLLPLWLILYVVRLIEAKIYVHFTIQSNGGDSTIAQQQQQQNNIIGRTKKAYNLYHQTPRLLDTLQLLLTSSNGEINVEKLVKKIEGYETDNAIVPVSDGEVKSRSSGGHRSHLPTLCGINLFELWSEFLLPSYFLIFGLIPTIIALFVRIYVSPWMARDCFGCEFEMLDVYLIGTSGAIAAIIVLSIIWLARREPDPLGVKQELLIMLCLCAPLGVLTFLLLFSYPTPHQSYTFSYYLLSDLAIFFVYLRKKKEIKLNLDMIVFHEQLSVLFLQHCTSELCAENYLFYKEAKKWKSESTKEDKRYLREHARVIYATYLSSKSPFEINIAGSVRDELVKQIKKGNENDSLPENLFDDALLEIRELITRDTLPRFYTSKEFQEKVMKTDLIDQLHNDMERRKASAVSPSGVLHRAISMRIS